ncbi:BRCA1-A complex subunit Abraxas 1-like [Dromiciops gliroides]|uniref:BRCA1-A complex subunit Abraxas 1-like n=1 Tax=Dromiciops gliroides TaxID=33562 RepID=UPI001CC450D4|nr:BRCA1-A complex subunit Abraxas 1-like [Dromiciops gliroides]
MGPEKITKNGREGFLLGEIRGESNESTTDSQWSETEIVYTIDIQRYIPCFQLFSFYNSSGEVNEQALQEIILGCEKNVIGWYKLRRNSDQVTSFRERILHENLQQHFSNEGLVFLLLTSSIITENCSTHRLDHALLRLEEGFFHKVPLEVAMWEQQGYKTVSGSYRSAAFGRTMHTHRSEFFKEDGTLKEVQKISEFYLTVQEELKEKGSGILESEHLVGKHMNDISRLKEELARRKRLKTGRSGDPEVEENVLLCQALRTFFPGQESLHSSSVCLKGRLIASKCCNTDHKLRVVRELTLMSGSPDLPEAEGTGCEKKYKPLDLESQSPVKKARVLQLQNQCPEGDDGNNDGEEVLTSSIETDADAEKMKDMI